MTAKQQSTWVMLAESSSGPGSGVRALREAGAPGVLDVSAECQSLEAASGSQTDLRPMTARLPGSPGVPPPTLAVPTHLPLLPGREPPTGSWAHSPTHFSPPPTIPWPEPTFQNTTLTHLHKILYQRLLHAASQSHVTWASPAFQSVVPHIHLPIYLTDHASIHLSNHLSIWPSIYPSIQSSLYSPTNLFIYLPIHPSIRPSSIHPPTYPSTCLPVQLSIHPPIYLAICPSILSSSYPIVQSDIHPSNRHLLSTYYC